MTIIRVAAIACLIAGCPSNQEPPPQQDYDAEVPLSGTLPRKMRNCPSGVATAKTEARRTYDGIDIAITSNDAGARREIVWRTHFQSEMRDPIWFAPPHSGMRGGPEGIGRCPVIHVGTMMTYQEMPEGVLIHIAARAPRRVAEVQEAVETRVRALARPAS